jgi:hypothetical protein
MAYAREMVASGGGIKRRRRQQASMTKAKCNGLTHLCEKLWFE